MVLKNHHHSITRRSDRSHRRVRVGGLSWTHGWPAENRQHIIPFASLALSCHRQQTNISNQQPIFLSVYSSSSSFIMTLRSSDFVLAMIAVLFPPLTVW